MDNAELIIIMPAYNEDKVIAEVIESWIKTLERLNINFLMLIFDDGSTDNTYSILSEMKNRYNDKIGIYTDANRGHGPVIIKAYINSISSEWIFQVDSDNEIDSNYFSSLWENRNNYEFLIGKRRNRGLSVSRKVISRVASLLVRLLYGKGISDVNCPFRLMKTEKVKEFFKTIPHGSFAPNIIISGMACLKGLKIFQCMAERDPKIRGKDTPAGWNPLKAALLSFGQIIYHRIFYAKK